MIAISVKTIATGVKTIAIGERDGAQKSMSF